MADGYLLAEVRARWRIPDRGSMVALAETGPVVGLAELERAGCARERACGRWVPRRAGCRRAGLGWKGIRALEVLEGLHDKQGGSR